MSNNKKELILFGIVISGVLVASSLLSISGQLIQEVQAQNMTNQLTTNATSTQTDMGTTTTTTAPSPCCPSNGHIANAGSDQTVLEGTIITLNGSNNSNKISNIQNTAKYLWRQTAGPSIILNGNNTAHPNFVAPNYPTDTKYTFALEVFEDQVINNNNQTGAAIDTVDIIVKDANIEAKNPGTFQGEDDNTEEQSNQNELQDEEEEEEEEEEQSDNDDDEDEDDDEEEEGNEDE
ncbi:MAG TPA: hypothetical protein VFY64_04680 [Nitrososphaeraceae archaeon]|nr:hypothetical protein [Nitrososphaeraceae archaeon]